MDFASLMSKELLKAKPPIADTSKKYIKRSEIEAQRRAAYLAEQQAIEEEREAKAAAKRKRDDEIEQKAKEREDKRQRLAEESRRIREAKEAEEERLRRKRLGLPETPPKLEDDNGSVNQDGDYIENNELISKLREIGAPAVLFGETHMARLRRYRRLTTVVTDGPIPTTLQPVEGKDMKLEGGLPKDPTARKFIFRQLASYFTMVLTEYQATMEQEKRDTSTSREAYRAMKQCIESMKPLYRKFEKGDIEESVLEVIVDIVKAAQERRYVDASKEYLRLSIGNAAWPIGVTMVGIHERSAREKLHGGEKGHVMGDEITRKYLQSIKRCLTFAQVRWPPTDIRQLMG